MLYKFDEIASITTGYDIHGHLVAVVRGTGSMGADMEEELRTSPSRRGLWQYVGGGKWEQILGTSQFCAKSRHQMRDKLRRMLTR